MDRKEFFRYAGMGGLLLASGGLLEACKKKEEDPAPTDVDFTIDLNDSDYSDLNTVGGYIYEDDIIVVQMNTGDYAALSKKCTHQLCTVKYRPAINQFECLCHNAFFDSKGEVISGPPNIPLKEYNTELNGTLLHVFS